MVVDDLFNAKLIGKILPRLVTSASIQFRRFLVPRNLEIVQEVLRDAELNVNCPRLQCSSQSGADTSSVSLVPIHLAKCIALLYSCTLHAGSVHYAYNKVIPIYIPYPINP